MKNYWQRWALKIDTLSLRERAIIFAAAALILIVLINTILLNPQYAKQSQLSQQIKLDQSQIAALQVEIQQKAKAQESDPARVNQERLQRLLQQEKQMHVALRDLQKGLVPPDKIAALLEDILKSNQLRLVALKTLPVTTLADSPLAGANSASVMAAVKRAAENKESNKNQPKSAGSDANDAVFKHGVEITVQGKYLDIADYLAQLEAMPWQLVWDKAKLVVGEDGQSTLTLTLFTLSLDEKWLNL